MQVRDAVNGAARRLRATPTCTAALSMVRPRSCDSSKGSSMHIRCRSLPCGAGGGAKRHVGKVG